MVEKCIMLAFLLLFAILTQQDITVNCQMMKVERFGVKHLSDPHESTWDDNGYTITMIKQDEKDSSKDELYVNHHHIHPKNWKYAHNCDHIVWEQDPQDEQTEYLAGHIAFVEASSKQGAGSMQFGTQRQTVRTYLHSSYSMDVSTNAGAYVASTGLKLNWDTNSATWKNATWDKNALTFTYWVEPVTSVVGQTVYQTVVVFTDNKTHTEWKPLPSTYLTNLDSNRKFTFSLTPPSKPSGDQFPYDMTFQFDVIAQNITGGAMLCVHPNTTGTVKAIRHIALHPIVGTYLLSNSSSLATHSGKLVVDGKRVENSGVAGNRLWWKGVESPHVPSEGFADFSEDGNDITASSFGAVGSRNKATFTPASSSASLTLQKLINMSPFVTDSNGISHDEVQRLAMEDFYKFIQYYMPGDYLHNFIAANPPDIGSLQFIVDQNPNSPAFYSSLAVPYLTNALSRDVRPSVRKLNARRAAKKLKQGIASSPVYTSQAPMLYAYQWKKKYPLMLLFLSDQVTNATNYNTIIQRDVVQWKNDMAVGMNTADHSGQQLLQQMQGIADNAGSHGKAMKYWGYVLFRYLTSTHYLSMIQLSLMNGNTSQTLSQDIMRFCSILNILDTDQVFSQEFVKTINVYQLTAILPKVVDAAGNFDVLKFLIEGVVKRFVDTYVNSKDPNMQTEARQVQKELSVKNMQTYLSYFKAAVTANPNWFEMQKIYQGKMVSQYSASLGGALAKMISMGAVAVSIILIAKGIIKFKDLTPVQQTAFFTSSVTTFALLLRKSAQFVSSVVAVGWGEAFSVVLAGKELAPAANRVGYSLTKWLSQNTTHEIKPRSFAIGSASEALLGASEAESSFLVRMFGRNMGEFMATRFAAVMGVVGLVLNSYSLATSTTQLDKAMNGIFVASSILDIVSAAATWAVAAGVGGEVIASVAAIAGGFAIAGAIAGIIIMAIIMSKHKAPPNPIDVFVNSQAVKDAKYYMAYETAVDYFQIIYDQSGASRSIGVAISPTSIQPPLYLHVSPDASLSLSGITYSYATVLSINTDENGYTEFQTKVWNAQKASDLLLTLDASNALKMAAPISDPTMRKEQQKWAVECTGNVKKTSNGILLSADFHIYIIKGTNTYHYLNGTDTTVSTSTKKAQDWNFSMQGMKPEGLSMANITLTTISVDLTFSPTLLQPGSGSGRQWRIVPSLPSWLQLNTKTGTISQKPGVPAQVLAATTYTIKVINAYNPDGLPATFTITCIQV